MDKSMDIQLILWCGRQRLKRSKGLLECQLCLVMNLNLWDDGHLNVCMMRCWGVSILSGRQDLRDPEKQVQVNVMIRWEDKQWFMNYFLEFYWYIIIIWYIIETNISRLQPIGLLVVRAAFLPLYFGWLFHNYWVWVVRGKKELWLLFIFF